jgi:hypothetical protein
MSGRRERAPAGLGAAGRGLWRRVLDEFDLNGAERELLVEACRTSDVLAAIDAALAGARLTVEGSTGQPRPHPLLAEARAQRRVLDQLVRALALPLPSERVGRRRSPTARENALARWHGDGAS